MKHDAQGNVIASNPEPAERGALTERQQARIDNKSDELQLKRRQIDVIQNQGIMTDSMQVRVNELQRDVSKVESEINSILSEHQGDSGQLPASTQTAGESTTESDDESEWSTSERTIEFNDGSRLDIATADDNEIIPIGNGMEATVEGIKNYARMNGVTPKQVAQLATRLSQQRKNQDSE